VLAAAGLAIKGWLAKSFATKDELNGYGDRLNAFSSIVMQVRELSDSNRDDIRSLQAEIRHQWERISAETIDPLRRITDDLQTLSTTQAKQTGILEMLVKHVETLTATRNPS
jgi:hypothetical protein